jgi:hypothetical protein
MAKKYTADTFEGAVTGTASGNVAKTGDTMTGDLKIQKSTPIFELNSNSIYPYGRIKFAGSTFQPYEIVGQSNPSTSSLALRGESTLGSSAVQDAFVVKTVGSGGLYNYSAVPLRIGADSSSNELDDYEEGVYTPTFYLGSGGTGYGSGNFTVFTNNSKYVKVGRMVTLYLSLEYNGVPSAITTSSQSIGLGNLPFSLSIGSQIGGTYQFGYLKNNVPSTYGYNSTFAASYVSTTTFARKILFTKLQYNGGISLYTNSGMTGSQFPTVGPFGTNNYLGGIITYYTND